MLFLTRGRKNNGATLSTLQGDDKIDENTGPAAKPEIITVYNESKVLTLWTK